VEPCIVTGTASPTIGCFEMRPMKSRETTGLPVSKACFTQGSPRAFGEVPGGMSVLTSCVPSGADSSRLRQSGLPVTASLQRRANWSILPTCSDDSFASTAMRFRPLSMLLSIAAASASTLSITALSISASCLLEMT
jgi:hypothetical protein